MTWLPEAGELQLGSYPCQMMLSPERLALPDYEYLGRSLGEGKKCRQIRAGAGSVWEPVELGRGGAGKGARSGPEPVRPSEAENRTWGVKNV